MAATVAPSNPSRSNIASPAASKSSRAVVNPACSRISYWIITLECYSRGGQAMAWSRHPGEKAYREIGGTGGPAGAAAGAVAVAAGGVAGAGVAEGAATDGFAAG